MNQEARPDFQPWKLEAPAYNPTEQEETACLAVLETRNPALLPVALPRWVFLQWLAERGWLLHGSQAGNLNELKPTEREYNQPDDFSDTRARVSRWVAEMC